MGVNWARPNTLVNSGEFPTRRSTVNQPLRSNFSVAEREVDSNEQAPLPEKTRTSICSRWADRPCVHSETSIAKVRSFTPLSPPKPPKLQRGTILACDWLTLLPPPTEGSRGWLPILEANVTATIRPLCSTVRDPFRRSASSNTRSSSHIPNSHFWSTSIQLTASLMQWSDITNPAGSGTSGSRTTET